MGVFFCLGDWHGVLSGVGQTQARHSTMQHVVPLRSSHSIVLLNTLSLHQGPAVVPEQSSKPLEVTSSLDTAYGLHTPWARTRVMLLRDRIGTLHITCSTFGVTATGACELEQRQAAPGSQK